MVWCLIKQEITSSLHGTLLSTGTTLPYVDTEFCFVLNSLNLQRVNVISFIAQFPSYLAADIHYTYINFMLL